MKCLLVMINSFLHTVFLVPKKTGDFRPVINLKPLNQFVEKIHFKMDNICMALNCISPGDFMVSIDLKDAYFSVPIFQPHRREATVHTLRVLADKLLTIIIFFFLQQKRAIIRGGRLFQIFLTGGPKIKEKVNKAIKEKVKYMNIAIEKTVKKPVLL